MTGRLLLQGMLAGLVAGLIAFGFARVFGEPQLERAVAFEAASRPAGSAPAPHVHGPGTPAHVHGADPAPDPDEVFSRAVQAGPGLATGLVVYGAGIGGLYALAVAFALGRLGRLDIRGTAALAAAVAFVATVLVPWLKYPANPPAIGAPETIGARTAAYFIFVAVSVVAAAGSVWLVRRGEARFGAWNAALGGAAAFIVAVGVAAALLPVFDEVPERFPAGLLWAFRINALAIQGVLWTVLGVVFGVLAERSLRPSPATWPARVSARST